MLHILKSNSRSARKRKIPPSCISRTYIPQKYRQYKPLAALSWARAKLNESPLFSLPKPRMNIHTESSSASHTHECKKHTRREREGEEKGTANNNTNSSRRSGRRKRLVDIYIYFSIFRSRTQKSTRAASLERTQREHRVVYPQRDISSPSHLLRGQRFFLSLSLSFWSLTTGGCSIYSSLPWVGAPRVESFCLARAAAAAAALDKEEDILAVRCRLSLSLSAPASDSCCYCCWYSRVCV